MFWPENFILLFSFPGMPYCFTFRRFPKQSFWLDFVAAKIGCLLCVFIDYDYDYYGYGDYRGGYSDPYYDDYYRYEDYYFDYPPPPPPARGRGRQPQPVGRSTLLNVPSRLFRSFVHLLVWLWHGVQKPNLPKFKN